LVFVMEGVKKNRERWGEILENPCRKQKGGTVRSGGEGAGKWSDERLKEFQSGAARLAGRRGEGEMRVGEGLKKIEPKKREETN